VRGSETLWLGRRYLFALRPFLRFGEDKTDSVGLAGPFGFDAMSPVSLVCREQAGNAAPAFWRSLEVEAGGTETIKLVVYRRPVKARVEAGHAEFFRRRHVQCGLPARRAGGVSPLIR